MSPTTTGDATLPEVNVADGREAKPPHGHLPEEPADVLNCSSKNRLQQDDDDDSGSGAPLA